VWYVEGQYQRVTFTFSASLNTAAIAASVWSSPAKRKREEGRKGEKGERRRMEKEGGEGEKGEGRIMSKDRGRREMGEGERGRDKKRDKK
jgi:hypothetical protein